MERANPWNAPKNVSTNNILKWTEHLLDLLLYISNNRFGIQFNLPLSHEIYLLFVSPHWSFLQVFCSVDSRKLCFTNGVVQLKVSEAKLWLNQSSLPFYGENSSKHMPEHTASPILAISPASLSAALYIYVSLILFVYLCPCTFKCSTGLVSGAECAIRKITTTNRRGWSIRKVKRNGTDHIQIPIQQPLPNRKTSETYIFMSVYTSWVEVKPHLQKSNIRPFTFSFCNHSVPHRALKFQVLL